MPREIVGRSASQHFFSVGGRAFCLFTVLGSHSPPDGHRAPGGRRRALAPDRAGRDDARAGGERVSTDSTDASDALAEVVERPTGLVRLVDRLSRRGGVSRRGLLVGAAVAGSALATDPKAYALMPQTAYATICGPGNTASSGWTIFCATVNKGVNGCPPGSFTAGWWKAADSSWCGGGYRYIVDCNAKCTKCSTGCSDHICDSRCWNCSCTRGSTATCDQRVNCCNAFRYGQCNTQVKCSGGVHCRVVSCVAPYKWENCSTTSFRSDATAEHSSPYLPAWGPMEQLYTAMGASGPTSRASTGPIRTTIDGTAKYVNYTRAAGSGDQRHRRLGDVLVRARALRRVRRPCRLGYPKGAAHHRPQRRWLDPAVPEGRHGRQRVDHDPLGARLRWDDVGDSGRENGPLQYPVAEMEDLPDGWIQRFQKGCTVFSTTTPRCRRAQLRLAAWVEVGREAGPLGFPDGRPRPPAWTRGFTQAVPARRACGALHLDRPAVRRPWGAVLDAWLAAGGARRQLRLPAAHVVAPATARHGRCEGGTITAWSRAGDQAGPTVPHGARRRQRRRHPTGRFEGGTITV